MRSMNPQSTIRNPQSNVSRRAVLQTGLGAAGGWMFGGPCSIVLGAESKRDRYAGLKSKRYLGPVHVETKVVDKDVFTEGPAVDRDGVVYFTNYRVEKILRYGNEIRVT